MPPQGATYGTLRFLHPLGRTTILMVPFHSLRLEIMERTANVRERTGTGSFLRTEAALERTVSPGSPTATAEPSARESSTTE